MYKYAVTLDNDFYYEFESKYHINVLNIIDINGAAMVRFIDADVTINVNYIKKLMINGMEYRMYTSMPN